jgi:hypothetical protein
MLHKLSCYEDGCLDVEGCEGMTERGHVLVLSKVVDQFGIFVGKTHPFALAAILGRSPPMTMTVPNTSHLPFTLLTEANPCSINDRQIITHVVDVGGLNHQ